MPLTFNTRHLEEKDLELTGQLPVSELALDGLDVLVHLNRPLTYDLTVQKLASDILVQGRLELILDCECSRCLKAFQYKLLLDKWTLHLPLEGPEQITLNNDSADLTPYLREDILLEYPQHPLCRPDCAELPSRAKVSAKKATKSGVAPETSAWSELNKLKF